MKKEWGRKLYVCCFYLNERSAIAWFRLQVWKLIGLRGGVERVICLFCWEKENESHTLLKCKETNE